MFAAGDNFPFIVAQRQNKEQERPKTQTALVASQSFRAAALWSVSESVSAVHAMPYITSLCAIWAMKDRRETGKETPTELHHLYQFSDITGLVLLMDEVLIPNTFTHFPSAMKRDNELSVSNVRVDY